jgi:hypothetical protein
VTNHQRIPRRDRDPVSAADAGANSGTEGISRRELLRAGVGAPLAAPLVGALGSSVLAAAAPVAAAAAEPAVAAAAAPLFFTAAELAVLDLLTEMILPADEHSGGASAAGVAAYLDRTLAEKDPKIEDYATERKRWKDGLVRIDQLTFEMHGGAFQEASPEQRVAVLERMAAHEDDPKTPDEKFFGELKHATGIAYYSSKVGMIDDIGYQGNRVIREFAGVDVSRR